MMKHNDNDPNKTTGGDSERLEPELSEAIGNFKANVDAWSEAMLSRPRAVQSPVRTNWRRLTKWALGCVVFVGTVSGGVYQNHRQMETEKAQTRAAELQQRELAAQRLKEEEDLMAKVDSDISREVPSALEPMALMDDNENMGN